MGLEFAECKPKLRAKPVSSETNMTTSAATSTGSPVAARRPLTRWQAAGLHLLICAAIATTLLTVMLNVWYPGPLFEIAGGSGLVMILVAVDVIIGPLITLVVFKSGKKGLKFDLMCIAALQLAALSYGIHTVYSVRPVFIVYAVDRFELVTSIDLEDNDLAGAPNEEFRRRPVGKPRFVAVSMPQDSTELQMLMQSGLAGKDVQLFPRYYVPYQSKAKDALKHARPIALLEQRDPATVKEMLASTGRAADSLRFLPLRYRRGEGAVVIDAASGEPVRILRIDPW